MQVGHSKNSHYSEYEMQIDNENKNKQNLDEIISSTEFPDDYNAFCDENLDMIP